MTKNPPRRNSRRTRRAAAEESWADLADLALIISRELQYRGYTDPQAVGLTQSEGMVMRYLLQGEAAAAAPSQIAAATGLQRTNLSATLRGLEQKELIERQANPTDGRGVTVSPTPHGRSNFALARHEWATAISEAAGSDDSHLAAAVTLLTTIKDGLVDTRPQSPSRHPPT